MFGVQKSNQPLNLIVYSEELIIKNVLYISYYAWIKRREVFHNKIRSVHAKKMNGRKEPDDIPTKHILILKFCANFKCKVQIMKIGAIVLVKEEVGFMSMIIGNNMGISNNSQNNTSKTSGYKNVREYSNYLMGKYSCLKPGNNVAVSITSGLLRKAMSDEKTGQWLERELAKAPDYIKSAQQSASARGSRLLSASIEFGEEYTTMCTCTVTDTPGTDEDIDKWLERVKENEKKQKAAEKKAEKKAAEEKQTEQRMEEYTFKGPDLKSVTDSFIVKMSSLSTTMSSVSGFDVKA